MITRINNYYRYLACQLRMGKNLDKRMTRIFQDNQKKPLLVIKERDVGFFSLFLQVVNTLICVEKQALNCQVVIEFGDQQSYFCGSNSWTDYFQQLESETDSGLTSQIQNANTHYKKYLKQMPYWDECGAVYQVDWQTYWTASYYPRFNHQSADLHINHAKIPKHQERITAAKVIEKYIKVNNEISARLSELLATRVTGNFVLGVQFRGTDARMDSRRKIPSYEHYLEIINQQLSEYGNKANMIIVVASDEQAFIDVVTETFANVISVDTIRHDVGDENYRGSGPQDFLMPAFIAKNKQQALKGAIMDYLLLCQSDVLIHNLGSLTNAVLLTKPGIKSILMGKEMSA